LLLFIWYGSVVCYLNIAVVFMHSHQILPQCF
jgi:hypothetical protein